jgi:predicted metal-dependent phosphoesterase TrpH
LDKYIDLHVHSTVSDGTYTPCELVKYAVQKKLAAIAITDHDCISGIKIARECAKDKNLEIISGIEFSTRYKNREIHILGLCIDEDNKGLNNELENIITDRNIKNLRIIDKLRCYGIDITIEDVTSTYNSHIYTRAHIAKAICDKGYASSIREAFDKYIGDNCPCYVPTEKVTPQRVIELILSCGGVPILAHPTLYHMDLRELDSLICELTKVGLLGIEGIYSLYTKSEERYIKDFADKYNLLISGGSDFHGDNKPHIDLGVGKGNLKIPYSLLEKIRAKCN